METNSLELEFEHGDTKETYTSLYVSPTSGGAEIQFVAGNSWTAESFEATRAEVVAIRDFLTVWLESSNA